MGHWLAFAACHFGSSAHAGFRGIIFSFRSFYLRVRTCAMAFAARLAALPGEWREKLFSIGFKQPMILASLKPAQRDAFLPYRPLEVEGLIGLAKGLEHGVKVKSSELPPPKLIPSPPVSKSALPQTTRGLRRKPHPRASAGHPSMRCIHRAFLSVSTGSAAARRSTSTALPMENWWVATDSI